MHFCEFEADFYENFNRIRARTPIPSLYSSQNCQNCEKWRGTAPISPGNFHKNRLQIRKNA